MSFIVSGFVCHYRPTGRFWHLARLPPDFCHFYFCHRWHQCGSRNSTTWRNVYTNILRNISETLVSLFPTTNPTCASALFWHPQTEWNSKSTLQLPGAVLPTHLRSTTSPFQQALHPFHRIPRRHSTVAGSVHIVHACHDMRSFQSRCSRFFCPDRARGILTRAARVPNRLPCPAAVHYGHLLGAGHG